MSPGRRASFTYRTNPTSSHDDVYGADTVGSNPVYGGDPVAQVYLDTPADEVYKARRDGSVREQGKRERILIPG